jgi:hypothetical protein
LPTIHIPDKYAYEIVRLGKDPKDFVKLAVKERLEELGVELVEEE